MNLHQLPHRPGRRPWLSQVRLDSEIDSGPLDEFLDRGRTAGLKPVAGDLHRNVLAMRILAHLYANAARAVCRV